MWSERSGLWKTSIKTLLSFPALLPFLRKCVELMPAMGSGGIHQQLLTERLIVKKNYILFLQHAMSYECGNLFLSGTNLSGLEDVLKIMLDGIVFETDPQGERAKRASLDEDENTKPSPNITMNNMYSFGSLPPPCFIKTAHYLALLGSGCQLQGTHEPLLGFDGVAWHLQAPAVRLGGRQ